MVFNFFFRLLVQKLEISKKTYRNRRKRTNFGTFYRKTFFFFFLVVNYFAAPKSAKQRHRTFCSAIYSWKKRGKLAGVPKLEEFLIIKGGLVCFDPTHLVEKIQMGNMWAVERNQRSGKNIYPWTTQREEEEDDDDDNFFQKKIWNFF